MGAPSVTIQMKHIRPLFSGEIISNFYIYGKIGKDFISEMSKYFKGYANDAAMECVALKAALVMPSLLLQRSHSRSKSKKEQTRYIEKKYPYDRFVVFSIQ